MLQLLLVGLGGAVGACLRYGVSLYFMKPGMTFPYATLIVNIAGSFLIGLLYVFIVEKSTFPFGFKPALMIGVLGALTTFSTFSIETLELAETGRYLFAGLNVVLNVSLSLIACFAALQIARLI